VYVYDTSEFGTRFTSKGKTGFCTYQVIYLHRLEKLGLLHALVIDASGMEILQLVVSMSAASIPIFCKTRPQICGQNMSNARATKAPSGHHNYRLPTRPDRPAIKKTEPASCTSPIITV
jgi:hypothetical protein